MRTLKLFVWFLVDLVGFRFTIEKYLPLATDFFLMVDELGRVLREGVKMLRDGEITAEERAVLAQTLELYRVTLDDVLVGIIEHLQEEDDVEELVDSNP